MTSHDRAADVGHDPVYWPLVRAEVPRILGLGDRDPTSASYGCFDRHYWHYRLTDFSDARFQEVALLLALLYRHALPGNMLVQAPAAIEWARAAVGFWERSRLRDGSVSEAYPGERSFCATAFSFAAVTEAALLLGLEPAPSWQRTADWLVGADNVDVANQMAAAAAALSTWSVLSGDVRYGECARKKVERVLARQRADGAFSEYGGGDVGYQTVTLGQLIRYQQRAKDDTLAGPLARAVAFVDAQVDAEGRHDAASGSRRTQFIYPYGLVALGSEVAVRHRRGIEVGHLLHPGWFDDRYVIPFSVDFLAAAVEPARDA